MGKLRPILFNTDMVRAILEGKKSQTRRICKVQPEFENPKLDWGESPPGHNRRYWWRGGKLELSYSFKSPAEVGDILWVRETFSPPYDTVDSKGREYLFAADYANSKSRKDLKGFWKPSIHMPFESARIFLRIKSLRIERLNDISEADAKSEGITVMNARFKDADGAYKTFTHAIHFMALWQTINGEESWNANPWVWVIEFEQISKEEALK